MEKNRRKYLKKYPRRQSAKDQKRRLRLTIAGIGLIIILAAGILGFQTIRLNQQKASYAAQVEQLESDIETEELQKKELIKKKIEISSDDYIESEARKRLGLIHKDEIIIKRKQ